MKPIALLAFGGLLVFSSLALNNCKPRSSADHEPLKASQTPSSLVITAIPDEKVSNQETKFQALATYLRNKLGIPVSFSISADYPASVQRFSNGEVHMAWFGGLTGVQARAKVPGSRAIAQGAADPSFKSYFIAHADTGLAKSETFPEEALRDLTFTFGSRNSTSGCLMPTFFIEKETGLLPEKFFGKPVQFQKSHDLTAKKVESGSVQAGVLNYKTYDLMVAEGKLDPAKAVVVWVTPEYADYNLTVHPDLDKLFGPGFIDKLQKTLVECDDPEVLKAFNRKKLIPAKNEDYQGIRKVAQALGRLR